MMREHLDHANVHDPADLAPGEPPDEAFEEDATTDVASVIDGSGRVVVDIDGSRPHNSIQRLKITERLYAKIQAEPPEEWSRDAALDLPEPWRRWRQLEDGTFVSDRYGAGPGMVVAVERATPADIPFIHVLGRTQEINPGAARWLSLRLAEASAIVETAVIP